MAIETSVHKSVGVGLFEDIEMLLDRMEQQPAYPTGYDEFDEVLGGGIRRKEMLLLSANSGGGKSIVMSNFGLNYLLNQGMSILYVSLELPVEMIAKRFVSMVTYIGQREVLERRSEVVHLVQQAGKRLEEDLIIERLPSGTTPNQLRAFIREVILKRKHKGKHKKPDVLLLDYIDLMGSNEKISADNVFAKDKDVSEQVREILFEFDMIGITASQQNRPAVTARDINHSHIAGGISKINTTDIYASVIFNDMLRAAGEIHFEFLKTRSSDGVGKRVELKWNRNALRIENPVTKPLTFKRKLDDNSPKGLGLSDILDI